MHGVTPSDGPEALVMGLGFFAFGLTMILRPDRIRANFTVLLITGNKEAGIPTKCPTGGSALPEW